jgi:predicted SAM-dependent methyltransferase
MMVRALAKETVREGLTVAARPFGKRRFQRALAQRTAPYRIVLGAAQVPAPGWIATDIDWRTPNYLDVTTEWPVPDASVSHIYADNVIEHISLEGARVAFSEMHRVLVPGGGVRLATPDVEGTARLYLDGGEIARSHLERHHRAGLLAEHRVDLLRVTFCEHGHHLGYLWDAASLADELTKAGFADVVRCSPGVSDDPHLVGLEVRGTTEGEAATMLVLEARRPA